jgi:hypothetical protein
MPRPKKPTPAPAAPSTPTDVPPSKTSHLFAQRPTPAGKTTALTHERLAADLEAFHRAGGKIEVLGITRVPSASEKDAAPPAAPAKARR